MRKGLEDVKAGVPASNVLLGCSFNQRVHFLVPKCVEEKLLFLPFQRVQVPL